MGRHPPLWIGQGRPDDRGNRQQSNATFLQFVERHKTPGIWAGVLELLAFTVQWKIQIFETPLA